MRTMLFFTKSWLLSTCILLPALSFAQVTQEWAVRHNGPGNNFDAAASLALDKNGNVYVTGESIGTRARDYSTIKYNAAGVQQWEARYNENDTGFSDDRAHAIAVDRWGNVYVTGGSEAGTRTQPDFATIKYNTDGVMQWVARYNGPGNGFDEAMSIGVDLEGNVYVTGVSADTGNTFQYTTIKYNANGIEQWVAKFGDPGNSSQANALALDDAGNVYVTGSSSTGGEFESSDYATIKYDNNGNELWVRRYDGPAEGNRLDIAQALALDESGNVYVTGFSAASNLAADYATIKYDTNGNEQWVARYNGPGNSHDQAFSVAVDTSLNVYVTGASRTASGEENDDYATIKYDANGNEVWVSRYNGPADNVDQAVALVLDSASNVYVTGRSVGIGTGLDFATIKYNTAGVEQWVVRYNGPENLDDGPGTSTSFFTSHPIAVDGLGNVYVTGISNFDYVTIKYSQAQALPACGKNGDKVLICHKGKKTLCIKKSDVADHLSHGDQLGGCPAPSLITNNARTSQPIVSNRDLPASFRVTVIPNPAAITTKIFYELPIDGRVSIVVFDITGREIITLVDAGKQAGFHSTDFNVTILPKGLYYYRTTVKTAKKVWRQTGKITVQ